MTVIWQSEIDRYASRILDKHWPNVPNLGDVTKIDWSTVERPDLICGGYPCQPFSFAGNRGGETDPRHLWPRMRDAIRQLRPRWVLLENVPGHLSLGFGRVLGDLADCGYDCEWDCIPAVAVGAPHLRYRVFVVAHATGDSGPDRVGLAGGNPLVGAVPGADGGGVDGSPPTGGGHLRRPVTAGETDVADPTGGGLQGGADPVGEHGAQSGVAPGEPARSPDGVDADVRRPRTRVR